MPDDPRSVIVTVDGTDHEIHPGQQAVIGRDAACEIVCTNPHVSRRHARIETDPDSGDWVLADLGSNRGSWVNGDRSDRIRLDQPTIIWLGEPNVGMRIDVTLRAAGHPTTSPMVPPGAPKTPASQLGTIPVLTPGTTPAAVPGGASSNRNDPLGTRLGPKPAPSDGPGLTVTLDGTTRTFETSQQVTIGRDPSNEIVIPQQYGDVSRAHVRIGFTGDSWVLTDLSSRGTFVDGSPVRSLALTGAHIVRLGDLNRGPELLVTVQVVTPPDTRRRPTAILVGALLLALIVAGGAFLLRGGSDSTATIPVTSIPAGPVSPGSTPPEKPDTDLPPELLAQVKRSVVHLLAYDADNAPLWSGSGTIITPEGAILTNAHVADATAAGQQVQYGSLEEGKAPAYLTVGITDTPDEPFVERYRAKVVVSDGYLDLAVVQIDAMADGSPLDGPVDLPTIPIGDSDAITIGQPLTMLGYPAAATSERVVVTKGSLSAISGEELSHLDSDRAWFEFDGAQRHGNSGGTVVDSTGHLIGVPTRSANSGGDISERIRPVGWAQPLIDIAASGGDSSYSSPYLTELSGSERAVFLGVSANAPSKCDDATDSSLPAGAKGLFVVYELTGSAEGVDAIAVLLVPASDGPPQLLARAQVVFRGENCFAVGAAAADLNLPSIPDGTYLVVVQAGPSLATEIGRGQIVVGAGGSGAEDATTTETMPANTESPDPSVNNITLEQAEEWCGQNLPLYQILETDSIALMAAKQAENGSRTTACVTWLQFYGTGYPIENGEPMNPGTAFATMADDATDMELRDWLITMMETYQRIQSAVVDG